MKVKIITDRHPRWGGKRLGMGEVVDVDNDAGETLIANGMAERVRGRPKAMEVADDD